MAPAIYDGIQNGVITLAHDRNSFTVNFESIDMRYAEDITYKYCLENFDSYWMDSAEGSISYKNLPPGKYFLRLKSIRISDQNIIDEKTIAITITPPWYNTWWAWGLYIAIVFILVFLAIRYYLDNVKKRYYEDKIRFFINTAHDIRAL